jgi:hypothetical protein
MAWHVRFYSPSLKHELLSPELETEDEALEAAWQLAQSGEDITAVEGPDGEIASVDEVDLWFREHRQTPPPPFRPAQPSGGDVETP